MGQMAPSGHGVSCWFSLVSFPFGIFISCICVVHNECAIVISTSTVVRTPTI